MDKSLKIKENLIKLEADIAHACEASKRKRNEITVIAASKYAGPEEVAQAFNLGIRHFGENRAEELSEKFSGIRADINLHFIGHLQSRKIKKTVPLVDCIQSIDRIKTLYMVNEEAKRLNRVMNVFLEINISGEKSKYGFTPEDTFNAAAISLNLGNIKLSGLMTVAPFTDNMEIIRDIFRELRLLKEDINSSIGGINMTELSMGMSNDFRIAIEEGATMLRIGSLIFK